MFDYKTHILPKYPPLIGQIIKIKNLDDDRRFIITGYQSNISFTTIKNWKNYNDEESFYHRWIRVVELLNQEKDFGDDIDVSINNIEILKEKAIDVFIFDFDNPKLYSEKNKQEMKQRFFYNKETRTLNIYDETWRNYIIEEVKKT